MQERLKEIPKKLLEYWNKWTSKQKTVVISVVSAVIVMIAILVAVLGRTKYVELDTFADTKTAGSVISLLRESTITTKLGSDNVTVLVDEEQYADAMMAVAASELTETGFDWKEMLNTSITTTNGERLLRQHLKTEYDLETALKKYYVGIDSIDVMYTAKDTSNRILSSSKEIPVSVAIIKNNKFKESDAETIAYWVAYAVGNETTELITIGDQYGNLLYNGPEDENEEEIDLTDKAMVEKGIRDTYIDTVKGAMLMNNFTDVDVAPNIVMDFNKVKEMLTEYLPLEGEIFGVMTEHHQTSSEGENGVGDIPGTDSNDEVDYMLTNGNEGSYETSTEDAYYQPSVRVEEKVYDQGTVNKASSSIAVTANRVITRTEEQLEILGLLDDMSFDEYVLRNSDPIQTETDEDLVAMISMATGIPEDNIKLITYDIYKYIEREEVARDWTFYFQILLAVILVAFLLFVVFRGMAPVEVTEVEPELSIETLLATTKENQSLEDVEFSEQSETRKMIEKFFEENPEAVAQLLRNWLNEDWD